MPNRHPWAHAQIPRLNKRCHWGVNAMRQDAWRYGRGVQRLTRNIKSFRGWILPRYGTPADTLYFLFLFFLFFLIFFFGPSSKNGFTRKFSSLLRRELCGSCLAALQSPQASERDCVRIFFLRHRDRQCQMARKKASKDNNCLTLRERSSILMLDRSRTKGGWTSIACRTCNISWRNKKEEFERTVGSIELIYANITRSSIQIRRLRHLNTCRFSDAALFQSNARCARRAWGKLSRQSLTRLAELTDMYRLSVTAGHLQFFDGRWYITHSGLLSVARRNRCAGIRTTVEKHLCDAAIKRWVFKATVYKGSHRKASSATATPIRPTCLPWSVAPRCVLPKHGPSIEPSAKPTESGLCSVEELGSFSASPKPPAAPPQFERSSRIERLKQRPAPTARPALPADPPAQSRSRAREGIRSGFLRHTNPQRS